MQEKGLRAWESKVLQWLLCCDDMSRAYKYITQPITDLMN